jgi:hypothetical protein
MSDDRTYQDVASLHNKVLLLERALDGANHRISALDQSILLNKKHIEAILSFLREDDDALE